MRINIANDMTIPALCHQHSVSLLATRLFDALDNVRSRPLC
jgi:hypothetical protein